VYIFCEALNILNELKKKQGNWSSDTRVALYSVMLSEGKSRNGEAERSEASGFLARRQAFMACELRFPIDETDENK
jgi:hypothetical protein